MLICKFTYIFRKYQIKAYKKRRLRVVKIKTDVYSLWVYHCASTRWDTSEPISDYTYRLRHCEAWDKPWQSTMICNRGGEIPTVAKAPSKWRTGMATPYHLFSLSHYLFIPHESTFLSAREVSNEVGSMIGRHYTPKNRILPHPAVGWGRI